LPTVLFFLIFLMIIGLLGILVSWEYKKQQITRTMRPNILLDPKRIGDEPGGPARAQRAS